MINKRSKSFLSKNSYSKINKTFSNFKENSNETLEKMNDEFFHINNYLKELNSKIDNHCLYQKEKENFNFLKKENIKMLADVSIMKDDIKDLILKFKNINDKINQIQKQNEIIKNQNNNLINFIELQNKNNQTENLFTNDSFNFNNLNNNNNNKINNINPQIISNLSVFNNNNNNNNLQSKNLNLNTFSDFSNNILNTNNFSNNYNEIENSNENKINFENGFNLTELNNNINSIIHKNNNNIEKRFLIPKKTD